MVFHGSKWGWRGIAARLLLAPVLAAGAAAPAVGQQAPARQPTAAPAKARAADPKELLKQGREALKKGDFDKAQDLARQADKANPSGHWGLFGDTPESLERDVREARAKADQARAEQLTKSAKELFAKTAKMKPTAEKMAALDQAYAMADKAVALQGPTDFWDDWFGDRPDKLKKEIDTARLQLRRTMPASELARLQTPPKSDPKAPKFDPKGTPAKAAATATAQATPKFNPTPVKPAADTAKPGDPPKVATAGLTVPAAPAQLPVSAGRTPTTPPAPLPAPVVPSATIDKPTDKVAAAPTIPSLPTVPDAPAAPTADKVRATRLLADGRALLKANKLAEAKMKAADARQLNVTYAVTEDTPDALVRDVNADGKRQVDDLTKRADDLVAKKEYAKAEVSLGIAKQIAVDLGFQTKPIEEHLAAVKKAADDGATVVAGFTPQTPPTVEAVRTGPDLPKVPDAAIAGSSLPPLGLPKVPTEPAGPPASAGAVAGPGLVVPTIPGATAKEPPTKPTPPAVAVADPDKTGVKGPSLGQQLLDQAAGELRRGDLEQARKLATQAHNGDYGPAVQDNAQKLLREIAAEDKLHKTRDARASFHAAADFYQSKQYDQALGVLELINPELLSPDEKAKLPDLMARCQAEAAKLKVPAGSAGERATAQAGPVVPGGQPTPTVPHGPASGLTDQVKALGDVEFQKLRSEGLEVQAKAQESFNRGDTDVAIQMLTDFTAKVKASGLSASRQNLLLSTGVDRRLETFRIMKRQIDFVTNEAKDKKDARERIVGRSVAEQQKKEEIAKKVREVESLAKAHKYREAEALALQVKTLDPDDPTLTAVYEMAKRQRRQADYQKIKDDKEHLFLESLNSVEKEGKFADIDNPVISNPERALIARMRGNGSEMFTRTLSATEREIEVRLDRPLSVEFQNAPLPEVIDEVRKKTQLNITTDDASLVEEKIDLGKVLVTDKLENLATRDILAIVLGKARLKFVIENNAIKVTTEKRAKGRMYTKVFSVMDLVTPIPDFALADYMSFDKAVSKAVNPLPGWAQTPSGAKIYQPTGGLNGGKDVSTLSTGGQGPGGVPPSGYGTMDNQLSPLKDSSNLASNPRANMSAHLMKMIKGMVHPYSWDDMGGSGKIDYFDIGGALVVNQTADVIREVQDLLESLRRLQETSVAVEIRVISLSEEFFERVGIDFSMNLSTLSNRRLAFEQSLTTGQFRPQPFINSIDGVGRGLVLGYNPSQGGFTPDLDIPVRSTSFQFGVPPFGGYPGGPSQDGGLSVGLAFLNDIQVFMFMEAAQGNRRVNIMQAPKVTLFNGQTSTVFVSDVAFFTLSLQVIQVGNQIVYLPTNTPIPIGNQTPPPGVTSGPGVTVTVQAIVSADRRFVRMNLAPTLTALTSATVPLFPVTAFITPVFEGGSQGVPIPFTQFFQQPSVSTISVQTTVAVPDGGTVVLGGLKTLAEGRNEFGPPVLSQIPYLNRLFRNQGIGRETRHIMIMVTPRIIIQSEEEFNQTGVTSGAGTFIGGGAGGVAVP